MRQQPPAGQVWAADTGRYASPQDYDAGAYLAWLSRLAPELERCLFATAPDTFGDAGATLADSLPMLPRIRALGYRAALVAQPELSIDAAPWSEFDALFVGGPNSWQHSDALRALAAEARRLGKWLHVGRVNTLGRLRFAQSIGADSADGTFLAFGPDQNTPRLRRWLAGVARQPMIWGGES
jgi:hypothetical protein